jgi:hypothetical protein
MQTIGTKPSFRLQSKIKTLKCFIFISCNDIVFQWLVGGFYDETYNDRWYNNKAYNDITYNDKMYKGTKRITSKSIKRQNV